MKKKEVIQLEATLSSKGQIVIGREIRKMLDLKPNQKLREYIQGRKIIIEPIPTLEELRGSLKNIARGKKTEEIIKEIKKGWTS